MLKKLQEESGVEPEKKKERRVLKRATGENDNEDNGDVKQKKKKWLKEDDDGLAQDCGNSIANALELPQSCTKASIYFM